MVKEGRAFVLSLSSSSNLETEETGQVCHEKKVFVGIRKTFHIGGRKSEPDDAKERKADSLIRVPERRRFDEPYNHQRPAGEGRKGRSQNNQKLVVLLCKVLVGHRLNMG